MATIDRKGNVGQLFDKRAETDIYVISLQEIVPLDIDHILFDFSGNIECTRLEWTRKMLEYANANPDGANVPFEVLSSRAIVGTFLLVLIKSTHRSHVQHKQDQDIICTPFSAVFCHWEIRPPVCTAFKCMGNGFALQAYISLPTDRW